MPAFEHLDVESSTLPIIAPHIHPWLRAVVALASLSFVSTFGLILVLTYKLIQWQIKSKRTNQFVILIFNLLWADIQQSLAFLLNVEWLRVNAVVVESPVCFVQGWLVSTGDLGSGVWCFAIGLHTLGSVVLNYRLKPRTFFVTIVLLWVFIYAMACIGVGMYPKDIYVRSGIWCWVNHEYKDLRLWAHYIWIFIFEFGNVIIYMIIYAILLRRIRSGYYTTTEAKRVRSIANLMVAYPVVYVICTLPLASARMAAMQGSAHAPSHARLCLAGAMITSNGWLDVLLYTLTRRIMIFSDEPPADDNGFDTFSTFWTERPKRFGVGVTIEADGTSNPEPSTNRRKGSKGFVPMFSDNDSAMDLCDPGDNDIKLVTTTRMVSEPAQPEDYLEMNGGRSRPQPRVMPVGRWSEDSSHVKDLELAHIPN